MRSLLNQSHHRENCRERARGLNQSQRYDKSYSVRKKWGICSRQPHQWEINDMIQSWRCGIRRSPDPFEVKVALSVTDFYIPESTLNMYDTVMPPFIYIYFYSWLLKLVSNVQYSFSESRFFKTKLTKIHSIDISNIGKLWKSPLTICLFIAKFTDVLYKLTIP